jgi:hypothetical protein
LVEFFFDVFEAFGIVIGRRYITAQLMFFFHQVGDMLQNIFVVHGSLLLLFVDSVRGQYPPERI